MAKEIQLCTLYISEKKIGGGRGEMTDDFGCEFNVVGKTENNCENSIKCECQLNDEK